MRHVRGGRVGTLLAVAAIAGCGGGSTSVSTIVVTAPAPAPPVAPPAPTTDVVLYPPPTARAAYQEDGLTLGCGTRAWSSNPAQVRRWSAGAVVLPQVQFSGLARLDSPGRAEVQRSAAGRYYVTKSPLTILPGPRARVTLSISAPKAKVAFMYGPAGEVWQTKRPFRGIGAITMPVCSYDNRWTAAGWVGGVVFDKPTCARIDLIAFDGTVEATRRVRLGVRTC